MKLSGSQTIPASRKTVWNGLNDPEILRQCIPGCEKITQLSPTEMQAVVVAKVGPVKASFEGAVTLSDLNPPESYRISGQGKGGLAGFASGGASVRLIETSATETTLEYDVDAQIGGKLAMLGSRLIDSTATSLAEQFFTRFATAMQKAGKAEVAASATVPAKAKKTKAKTAKKAAKKKPAKR
jgi:uncharacterized protein